MICGAKFSALQTKLKKMYASMLNEYDYDELLSQANLKDVISYLKIKFPMLKNLNENMHRRAIEEELNNIYIYAFQKIERYINKKEKEYLKKHLEKYEIIYIKNILREIVTEDTIPIEYENSEWKNFIKNNFKEIEKLNNKMNYQDFAGIMSTTRLKKIFNKYPEYNDAKQNLDEIEESVDRYFFEDIYEYSKGNTTIRNLYGYEIDFLNISWIYRMKKYFNYSEKKMLDILIPVNYKLNKSEIKKLVLAESVEDFKKTVNIKYDFIKNEETIMHDIDRFLFKENYNIFKTQEFNVAIIISFMNLLEYQIRNIINIIEGIRYHQDREKIQEKIIN